MRTEASLPLEAINQQAAKEKSIRDYDAESSSPVDTDAIASRLQRVVDGVVRHIVYAPCAENVTIVLDVSAENSDGFSEGGTRTVREDSRVLGFDKSDSEDVEW